MGISAWLWHGSLRAPPLTSILSPKGRGGERKGPRLCPHLHPFRRERRRAQRVVSMGSGRLDLERPARQRRAVAGDFHLVLARGTVDRVEQLEGGGGRAVGGHGLADGGHLLALAFQVAE